MLSTGRLAHASLTGSWAPYWYNAVLASTGFEPYRPREIHLEPEAAEVAPACLQPCSTPARGPPAPLTLSPQISPRKLVEGHLLC